MFSFYSFIWLSKIMNFLKIHLSFSIFFGKIFLYLLSDNFTKVKGV
ncbi:hypothetical protein RR45_GL001623 [Lactococcus chungangensis CAU 28 = DSM 22330]|uniref:Uncharacterized protein n=1 Tax=Pseudolactococcus chungangensis CAU 28 = DSM 22330 TaxID=1122154 RepID=A0ABX4I4C1_9LACT|nr:hypothetical protein RR45_GL001623 [Lactococcus chungangensis CAU 28 = DSM 22330]